MDTELLVTVACGITMLLGVVGTIAPFMPGLSLIAVAAIVYAIFTGLSGWAIVFLGIILTLCIVATVVSVMSPTKRAQVSGANGMSVFLGFALALFGFFAIPVIGLILGGIAGIYLGEVMQGKPHQQAMTATNATLRGFGVAFLVHFGAAIASFGTWVAWVLLRRF